MMAAVHPTEICTECRKGIITPAYVVEVVDYGVAKLCSSACLLRYAIRTNLTEGASKAEILALATEVDSDLNTPAPCMDLWDCEACSDGADCPNMEGLE